MADQNNPDLNSSVHSVHSVHSVQSINSVGSGGSTKDVVCAPNPIQEKMTLGKVKFGSTDDLMALAAQSFAGTRTAKIIHQFKEWDSTHSADRTFFSKTSSTDNLLETQPSDNLKKYYDNYAADKAIVGRRSVMEETSIDVEGGESPGDSKEHQLSGFSRLMENMFRVEERGEKIQIGQSMIHNTLNCAQRLHRTSFLNPILKLAA